MKVVLGFSTVIWKIIQTKMIFFIITCTKKTERFIKNVMFWFDVDFKILYLVLKSCSCTFVVSVCFLNLIFYNLVIHNHTIYTISPLYVVMNIEQFWDWFIQLHKKSKQVICVFSLSFRSLWYSVQTFSAECVRRNMEMESVKARLNSNLYTRKYLSRITAAHDEEIKEDCVSGAAEELRKSNGGLCPDHILSPRNSFTASRSCFHSWRRKDEVLT